jgi:hypothetical protein
MKLLIAFMFGYATKAVINYIRNVIIMQKVYKALDKEWLD